MTSPSPRVAARVSTLTTRLAGWRRWLPEWLPEPSGSGIVGLRDCSPAATVVSGRVKLARLAPGRKCVTPAVEMFAKLLT